MGRLYTVKLKHPVEYDHTQGRFLRSRYFWAAVAGSYSTSGGSGATAVDVEDVGVAGGGL
jgi:hypothetical protein